MNSILLGTLAVFSVSSIVCLVSIPRARRIQHPETRQGLVGLLVAVGLWSGGYVGYLLAPTRPSKLAFYILGFSFAFVAVGAWLYFCAAYTGRQPRDGPYRKTALTVFLLIIALKVTNPLHSLYFSTEWRTEPFPHVAIHHQLLYWVVLGLSYVVIGVGFFMLIERFYHAGADSRPLGLLVVVTALPAVLTISGDQIDGLLPLMYEPPGVALFAVGTLLVYGRRFEAIRLTGETDAPAIFLDQDDSIRDYNQAARSIFPELRGSIGTPLASVSESLAAHLTDQEVISVTQDEETRFYEVSRTPFMAGEVTTGQLVTITDVTDRETYRQQLEAKTEQLEALNRVVRHDIRNDMTVILGWAETLQDHIDQEGEDALETVLQSSRHVIELTEIARDSVESLTGEGTPELTPVNLRHALETELATARESHPNAEFHVTDDIPQVSVRANEMLSSVFRNLLANAVQHTDEAMPEITVTVVEDSGTVRVRVADNGPGVPDEQKAEIFGKGEKGLESAGSGIGLYLVHTLTEQFGGDVWVEDTEPTGAVFIVELSKAE